MTYRFDGYNYVVRLEKGELLIQTLTELVVTADLPSVWISGLGGALWAELGFYDLGAQEYRYKRFERLLEITSLQGNLAWQDGRPAWHMHGTFSDETFQAFGGHIKELAVAGTCELLLHHIYGDPLVRQHDKTIGLNLLNL